MMSGIYWSDITCGNKLYSMAHLHKRTECIFLNGREITINFTFGSHVFTDEKGVGKPILIRGEERYFCVQRYTESFYIVDRILRSIEDDYVTSFIAKTKGRRYYHINNMDDFILMEIRVPQGLDNTINLNVVTAYTFDAWSDKSKLPRGRNLKFRYILDKKVNGEHNI